MDKTASNRFCNMLMSALYKVLQRADACYNLPPGVWIFYDFQSEGKLQRAVLNLRIQCVCHTFCTGWGGKWWGARKVLETISPQGFLLIRLAQNTQIKFPSHRQVHAHILLPHTFLSRAHTFAPICSKYSQLSWFAESQPALQLPSFLQTGNPQLPGLTPHANAVKQNPSPIISSIWTIHPKFQCLTFFSCPLFVPTKTREWFL